MTVIERLADNRGLYACSGYLRNWDGIAKPLEFETWYMTWPWSYDRQCGRSQHKKAEIVNGKLIGVIRIASGRMPTIANVDTLIQFLQDESIFNNHPLLL